METIVLTKEAQEHALALLKDQSSEKEGLRVAVTNGGCNGLSYKLGFDRVSDKDDIHKYDNGLTVMVDQKSAVLLEGSILEFHNKIEQTGFEVINSNAGGTCGCGKSFSC